jgi:hypothetical protein
MDIFYDSIFDQLSVPLFRMRLLTLSFSASLISFAPLLGMFLPILAQFKLVIRSMKNAPFESILHCPK